MIEELNTYTYDDQDYTQDALPNHCETYGDKLEEEAQLDTTRIYIQN